MQREWHPQDIMAAVRKKGSNLQRLAREHGFAKTSFNRALTSRFPNAHAIIAAYLGVSRGELWPQWYAPDGSPRFQGRADLQRRGQLRPTALQGAA